MNKTIFNLIAIVEDCQLDFSEKLDRLSDRLSYRLQIAVAKPDFKDRGWLAANLISLRLEINLFCHLVFNFRLQISIAACSN